MSDVKHTPGEWFVWSDHNGVYQVGPSINLKVASIWKPVLGDAGTNARLLAAAPDLLEALKALRLQALQSDLTSAANEWGREAIAMANAAIAKASGEQI